MPKKFYGTIEELKLLVNLTGIRGRWRADGSGKHTYRSSEGGILNWWTNGTVNFQGTLNGFINLQRSLVNHLSTIPATNCDYVDAEYVESAVQPHNNAIESSGNTASLQVRIVDILTAYGYAANKINDSTYVVSDCSGHSHCFLNQKLFDVLLPE